MYTDRDFTQRDRDLAKIEQIIDREGFRAVCSMLRDVVHNQLNNAKHFGAHDLTEWELADRICQRLVAYSNGAQLPDVASHYR